MPLQVLGTDMSHSYTMQAGVAQWQFSDDTEQEIWDVLGSNPALHP